MYSIELLNNTPFYLVGNKINFPVWLRNRLISAILEPVLGHFLFMETYIDEYFICRELEAWHATAKGMQRIHQFRGDEFGSISSVVAVHPTLDIIIGGNSSGRVHAFM